MSVLTGIHGQAALLLLAVSTLLHETGVPLPITPVAMFLAARSVTSIRDLVTFVAAMVVATLIGNLVWFNGGRRHGMGVLMRLWRRSPTPQARIADAARAFERWGPLALVFGRIVPGVTVVAPPLAGALGMNSFKFAALTSLGATLYSVTLLGAGVVFRDEIETVLHSLDRLQSPLVIAFVVVLLGCAAWRCRRHAARGTMASSSSGLVAPSAGSDASASRGGEIIKSFGDTSRVHAPIADSHEMP